MEEEEVHRMLRECLELREEYVYKEEVAPWKNLNDVTSAVTNADLFHFHPIEKTNVSSFLL